MSIILAKFRKVSRVFFELFCSFLPFSPPPPDSTGVDTTVCRFFFCVIFFFYVFFAHTSTIQLNIYRLRNSELMSSIRLCVHTHTLDAISRLRQDCVKPSRKLTLSGNLPDSCHCVFHLYRRIPSVFLFEDALLLLFIFSIVSIFTYSNRSNIDSNASERCALPTLFEPTNGHSSAILFYIICNRLTTINPSIKKKRTKAHVSRVTL